MLTDVQNDMLLLVYKSFLLTSNLYGFLLLCLELGDQCHRVLLKLLALKFMDKLFLGQGLNECLRGEVLRRWN